MPKTALKNHGISVLETADIRTDGCSSEEDRVIFRTAARPETKTELLVLDPESGTELLKADMPYRPDLGNVRALSLTAVPSGAAYCYLHDGVKVTDPYARAFRNGLALVPEKRDEQEEPEAFPMIPPEDLLIYKLHVRGYTMKAKGLGRVKGTFAGLVKMIPYISSLGFNAVMLMPCYEFDESLKVLPYQSISGDPAADGTGPRKVMPKNNFWGYAEKNFYFAPKERYAASKDSVREMREMIRAFHMAGIEVLMEMYLPYGRDVFAIRDALRMWRVEYRIDGFHLLGDVPFEMLAADPVLGNTKLFFEHPDSWRIYGGDIPSSRHIYALNEDFMRNGRAFLKGDEAQTAAFAAHLRENPTGIAAVHFMASNNGFTLYDMVSYDWKHNEENGENNADGSDFNLSWNCGAEGSCRRRAVRSLRLRQIRNALMYIFLSQSVPMLYAGDEALNSQQGNNNAYSMDNERGWVDWNSAGGAKELRAFAEQLIRFRKKHPILHMKKELRGSDYRSLGYPDLSFHDEKAWACSFENASRSLAVMLNGRYTLEEGNAEDDLFYLAFNAHWEKHAFALPELPDGMVWYPAVDSAKKAGEEFASDEAEPLADQTVLAVEPRSVCVIRAGKTDVPEVSLTGSEE